MARLFILGGLPGTGKSTIARELCGRTGATWLRIDTIEHALLELGTPMEDMGGRGYELAYAIAADNLRCGQDVIADSVNPIALTRAAWRRVAAEAGQNVLEIEVHCSDVASHQRRVSERAPDLPGLKLPTWEEVTARDYEPWPEARLIIDTALLAPEKAVDQILRWTETPSESSPENAFLPSPDDRTAQGVNDP